MRDCLLAFEAEALEGQAFPAARSVQDISFPADGRHDGSDASATKHLIEMVMKSSGITTHADISDLGAADIA